MRLTYRNVSARAKQVGYDLVGRSGDWILRPDYQRIQIDIYRSSTLNLLMGAIVRAERRLSTQSTASTREGLMKLIRIETQSVIMDFDGDPDNQRLPLSMISYRMVDIPDWKPGAQLADRRTGDIGYYVGPTQNKLRAVIQWAGGDPRFTAVEWDSVEPYDNFGKI